MRSRGLVVVLAFLLAAGATAAVFLYVRGVRDEARTGGEVTTVVVATEPIAAGTDLDPVIEEGIFTSIDVPTDALVAGAVTSLEQLRGGTTSDGILPNEQIPTARLEGSLPGGGLGIEPGYQAVTIRLPAERVVGPGIQRGSKVTVYGLFSGANAKTTKRAGGEEQKAPAVSGVVVAVVPEVDVLDVLRPGVAAGAQAGDQEALVTLELTPRDAQKVIFAHQQGIVWLALIPPEGKGPSVPPLDFMEIGKK